MGTLHQSVVASGEVYMNSRFLTGKVLLPAEGRRMPKHLANYLRAVPSIGKVAIAITGNAADAMLVALAGQWGNSSFRRRGPHVMRCVA